MKPWYSYGTIPYFDDTYSMDAHYFLSAFICRHDMDGASPSPTETGTTHDIMIDPFIHATRVDG